MKSMSSNSSTILLFIYLSETLYNTVKHNSWLGIGHLHTRCISPSPMEIQPGFQQPTSNASLHPLDHLPLDEDNSYFSFHLLIAAVSPRYLITLGGESHLFNRNAQTQIIRLTRGFALGGRQGVKHINSVH